MNDQGNIRPPRWPLAILRFFIKDQYLEEIEGDMEEIFQANAKTFSPRKANRLYALEMIKLLRPVLIRNLKLIEPIREYSMLRNYGKVTLRGLMKYPLNSSINVFGLAAAISVCIFPYAFARWTFDRDTFHENRNAIFLMTFLASRDGSLQQYGTTPRPVAELLRQDFPQIKKICRVEDRNAIVKHNDNVFYQRVRFTDPDFLEMFTFPLKWGTPRSLHDPNSIILSEAVAIKYFGGENPVGKTLLLKLGESDWKDYKVAGVAEPFPSARSFDFGLLANIENLPRIEPGYNPHDWSAFTNATLIQVANPGDTAALIPHLEKYKHLQHGAVAQDWQVEQFAFEPLSTIHLTTDRIRDDIFRAGSSDNVKSIFFLSAVAILMLALACFNYINIAIATATRRLKELGVRKTIGATRRMMVIQFLSENLLITFFALALGLLMARTMVIPWFENLWHFDMAFTFQDHKLVLYLALILLVTAIASGIYPSLYLSRFQTVTILKGSVSFGKKNPVTRLFLGFQLVLACVFITTAVVFTQNTDYLSRRSWGYGNRDVVYAVTPNALSFEQLQTRMDRDPHVVSSAGSADHIGRTQDRTVLHLPNRQLEVTRFAVGPEYFQTLGLSLREGRFFHTGQGADHHAVVINETMINHLSWSGAVGRQFRIDSVNYEVVGVVSDFHSSSFFSAVEPTIFTLASKDEFRYLSLKVDPSSKHEIYETLKSSWSVLFPDLPFEGGFQEDVWGNYYVEIGIHGHVWRVFATVSILIAVLGLYGLVSLNVAGRAREFSIRKVLGATLGNIAGNIFSQYTLLFAAALVIGVPLSHFFITTILDLAYTYHMPVNIWSAMLGGILLLVVLVSTVSTQVRKVGKASPVQGLKME